MQCTRYTLGCYYPRDLNVGLSGVSWPPRDLNPGLSGVSWPPRDLNPGLSGVSWPMANGDVIWNGGRSFNVLLPPPTVMGHDLGPQKEICRQMMLKHESTFRYQVYELHRLYRRQKELMEEARKRELSELSLMPLVSETISEISMESLWPSRNVSGIRLSLPSPQEPFTFIAHNHAIKDYFEGCQGSSSQGNKSKKRMLDLELPGDFYIDSEEENEVQVSNTPFVKLQPVNESKLGSFYPEGSSMSDSSCKKTNFLFDLNEPAQLDESDFLSSYSVHESETSQHENMNQNRDPYEKETTNEDCSLPNKETLPDINDSKISPLLEKDGENGLPPSNSEAGEDGSNLNSYAEASCYLTPNNECKRRRTLDSKMPEKNRAEANIDVPSLVSSQGKSINLKMPEKNRAEANIDVPSLVSSQGKSINESKEFPVLVQALRCINDTSLDKCRKSSVSKPRLGRKKFNLNKRKHASSRSTTRDAGSFKVSNCGNFSELSGDEFSDPNSISCLNPSESEEKETDRKLSTCINLRERDLKAPISPENWECSPPRGDSQETQQDRSIGLFKEEVNDRLAADALISILSSEVPKYSKTGIEQPGCLDWFAGIASTLGNDQGNKKVKYRARKVKKVEKGKETVAASLPRRLKKIKPEVETKDRVCSGRRKVRSGHAKGTRSSKALKTTNFKREIDGKKLGSAERCFKAWGSKKKRMARRARSTPFSAEVFGI